MKAFIVSVNGKQICTAGVGAEGVLASHVTWAGREGSGNFSMHVGGLVTTSSQHVNWPVTQVGIGDEVITRIVETDVVDPPLSSRTKAEIEAAHKDAVTSLREGSSASEAALTVLNPHSGTWEPQRIRHFTTLPRIGEWVEIELNGIAVMAKIVMVIHPAESKATGGVNLYAVVEGETGECLERLAKSP